MHVPEPFWYLKNTCPIFDGIPEADLAPLQALLTRAYLEPGERVALTGGPDAHVYFVKVGRLKLVQLGAEGRSVTLDFLDRGEIFGPLAGHACAGVEAIAAEPSAVCRIPREHFDGFVTRRPEVAFGLARAYEDRLGRVQVRLAHLMFKDLRGRVLDTLGYLAGRYGGPAPDGRRVGLRLTHQEIAGLVGSTREAITPVLTALRAEGKLRFEGKEPVLVEEEARNVSQLT